MSRDTGTGHVEIEKKYEAPREARPDFSVPAFAESGLVVLGDPVVEDLDATYFDTADGLLGRRRVVVRRRLGGYDEGWHIKFVQGEHRRELIFDLLADRQAMPAAVRDALEGILLGAELVPIATLRTHRERTLFAESSAPETSVLEWCDDSVRATDLRTGTERVWREWEVELHEEAPDRKRQRTLFAVLEAPLLEAGARVATTEAKIARALGQDRVFDAAEGIEAAAPESDREASAGPAPRNAAEQLVADLLGPIVEDIALLDLSVRADLPDAVHQLRIRLRRARALLHTLRGAVDPQLRDALRDGLRAAGAALGEVRDLEVVAESLAGAAPWQDLTQRARTELLDLLGEDETERLRAARRHLSSEEYLQLRRDLDAFARAPRLHGWVEELVEESGRGKKPKKAEQRAKKLRRAVGEAMLEESVERYERQLRRARKSLKKGRTSLREDLHEVRKSAKSLRYTAEALVEHRGLDKHDRQEAERTGEAAKAVQSDLGRILDRLVAHDWLLAASRKLQRRELDRWAAGRLTGWFEGTDRAEDVAGALRDVR